MLPKLQLREDITSYLSLRSSKILDAYIELEKEMERCGITERKKVMEKYNLPGIEIMGSFSQYLQGIEIPIKDIGEVDVRVLKQVPLKKLKSELGKKYPVFELHEASTTSLAMAQEPMGEEFRVLIINGLPFHVLSPGAIGIYGIDRYALIEYADEIIMLRNVFATFEDNNRRLELLREKKSKSDSPEEQRKYDIAIEKILKRQEMTIRKIGKDKELPEGIYTNFKDEVAKLYGQKI